LLLLLQDVICNAVFGNSLDLVPSAIKTGYGTVPRSVTPSTLYCFCDCFYCFCRYLFPVLCGMCHGAVLQLSSVGHSWPGGSRILDPPMGIVSRDTDPPSHNTVRNYWNRSLLIGFATFHCGGLLLEPWRKMLYLYILY